ncbi:MAG: rubrerythrin family protein, partial [Ruthenibacterium sp.]
LLILPYLLLPDAAYLWALGIMLVTVVLIIFVFNYYVSVAKSLPFKRRFLEMACISLGVATLSFVAGIFVKQWLGVEI